jgi:hypothetical protein
VNGFSRTRARRRKCSSFRYIVPLRPSRLALPALLVFGVSLRHQLIILVNLQVPAPRYPLSKSGDSLSSTESVLLKPIVSSSILRRGAGALSLPLQDLLGFNGNLSRFATYSSSLKRAQSNSTASDCLRWRKWPISHQSNRACPLAW